MNKLLTFIIALLCVLCTKAKTDVVLDTGWVYRPISDPTPTAKDTPVTLPHTWNTQYVKGTEYNRETMVYTRRLTVGDDMLRGKRRQTERRMYVDAYYDQHIIQEIV